MEIPNFITHYSRSQPFQSMTSLSQEKLTQVLSELNEDKVWGKDRFFDTEYLMRRQIVEQTMRQQFIEKGGNPTLKNPIYFFLGRDSQFEQNKKNDAYVILLNNIDDSQICFTYGDSMLTYNHDYRIQFGQKYQNSLCAKTFLKSELQLLFSDPEFLQKEKLRIEALLWAQPKLENVQHIKFNSICT